MRPFVYRRAEDATTLVQILSTENEAAGAPTAAEAQFIAGGTTILDLMKLDVMRPSALIDINGVRGWDRFDETPDGLRLGALARMADVARHALVKGKYPVIAESLALAASAQLRNMATLGGNVLQRTRCTYFRDVSWPACNKRNPGSGCAAIGGFNRAHAVLGVSPSCIATYPGDFAQALIALDATVETWRGGERRTFPFAELHRPPGDRPDIETTLAPDELILAFRVPRGDWTRRSRFLKIRDRSLRVRARLGGRRARHGFWGACPAGADRCRRRCDNTLAGARGRGAARWPAGHRGDRRARRRSGVPGSRTAKGQRVQDRARAEDARAGADRDRSDVTSKDDPDGAPTSS